MTHKSKPLAFYGNPSTFAKSYFNAARLFVKIAKNK